MCLVIKSQESSHININKSPILPQNPNFHSLNIFSPKGSTTEQLLSHPSTCSSIASPGPLVSLSRECLACWLPFPMAMKNCLLHWKTTRIYTLLFEFQEIIKALPSCKHMQCTYTKHLGEGKRLGSLILKLTDMVY